LWKPSCLMASSLILHWQYQPGVLSVSLHSCHLCISFNDLFNPVSLLYKLHDDSL
jgi:hypothetical protein